MQTAIKLLLSNLEPTDSFGLITFAEKATVIQELAPVSRINRPAFEATLSGIGSGGGTSLSVSVAEATRMLRSHTGKAETEESRMLFLTDMCDSAEDRIAGKELHGLVTQAATDGMHSTFIGLGTDFNSDVSEVVTKVAPPNKPSLQIKLYTAKNF